MHALAVGTGSLWAKGRLGHSLTIGAWCARKQCAGSVSLLPPYKLHASSLKGAAGSRQAAACKAMVACQQHAASAGVAHKQC